MKKRHFGKIMLPRQLDRMTRDRAVEFALLQGFQTISAQFPIVSDKEGIPIPKSLQEVKNLVQEEIEQEIPENYISATEYAKELPDIDQRKKKGLEMLFLKGFFLKDEDYDQLPDKVDVKLVLPEDCDRSIVKAACNIAFRFGMETTGYQGTIVAPEGYEGNAIVFRPANSCSMELIEQGDKKIVYLYGQGKELEEFSAILCETFPLLADGRTWQEQCMDIANGLDGKQQQPYYQEVYKKEYDIPWEVDVFQKRLEERIYPLIGKGDTIEIDAALSEEQNVRAALCRNICARLEAEGAKLEKCEIICAYKQGFSWMQEMILPKLANKSIEKIEIQFRPFLPEGQTDWMDEDGAVPSYTNLGANDPEKWYDLPIRPLQELYPIVDVIEEQTGISKDSIIFLPYEGNENLTYLVRAVDKHGTVILEDDYLASYTERPYLDAYPEMGKVHPSTGFLRVLLNGTLVLDERIRTDVEAIWDIYQKEVLRDVRQFIEDKFGDNITEANQPFFSKLCLEVTASEPDYRLHSRQDMISSLDALHEDMYFVGTDYFKNYGMRKKGELFDAPGLILPIIKKKEGKPTFTVTLQNIVSSQTKDDSAETISELEKDREVYIEKLSCQNGNMMVHLYVGKEKNTYQIPMLPKEKQEKNLDIREIDFLESSVIGYEQYKTIMQKLKQVKGISVFQTAISYEGREIDAIELLTKRKGYVSRTKRLNLLPSIIINARHHANEVAGTNAAFLLLKQLLTDEKYADIAEKLNLVIVPMENVDGAALHYELQKENPYWKLHVARFNAVGKEFGHEYYKMNTIHTEALGMTKLWYKYLPDLIVDNHGVPSHEWNQPFSGYTSPSFKGFWLPRSLLYGYFWVVTQEKYKSNYAVNKKMEDVIADAISVQPEIHQWNQEWMKQFEKFAHGFMPKLFPANYYKEMINYWIPISYNPVHHYASIRSPWITTVCYTSEVADETAQGEYLNLCARTHVIHNLAALEMWMNAKSIFKKSKHIKDNCVSISCIRQRPIIV